MTNHLRHVCFIAAAGALLSMNGACAHSPIRTVDSFRAARASGDLDAAAEYLGGNPRVWYESKEGEGSPWRLGAGRYKDWDEHFRSESNPGPWRQEPMPDGGFKVWRVVEEWNEYYALIEREDTPRYRITYFLGRDRSIEGYMISAASPDEPRAESVSRFDDVRAWCEANDPDEWAHIRPGGKLDPTGDRAERTRSLFNRWRESVGLERID